MVDPLDLAIFIGGAVLAILLGLASAPLTVVGDLVNVLGAACLLAFGAVILTGLSLPIEELLSVGWILGFGVAATVAAYLRVGRVLRSRPLCQDSVRRPTSSDY